MCLTDRLFSWLLQRPLTLNSKFKNLFACGYRNSLFLEIQRISPMGVEGRAGFYGRYFLTDTFCSFLGDHISWIRHGERYIWYMALTMICYLFNRPLNVNMYVPDVKLQTTTFFLKVWPTKITSVAYFEWPQNYSKWSW